jgi:hypothetical protein
MKKNLLFLILSIISLGASAQELSQVAFTDGANLNYFSFITDQKVVIRITPEGKIIEWGTDPGLGRFNYYSGKLQPYMGRVDYYRTSEYDSILRNKVRSIGTCNITYYGSNEVNTRSGKIKSIGSVELDYIGYESIDNKGKIKSIGYNTVEYYPASENEAYRGKLKSIGLTAFTWYSSFDDKLIKGKIKSIGNYTYTWYASYELHGYGGLKAGSPTQLVNGVTYIVR